MIYKCFRIKPPKTFSSLTMSSWLSLKKFEINKKVINATPFERNGKIIYCADFDNKRQDKSGIYEYDVINDSHKIICLWKNINYFPTVTRQD